MPRYIAVLLFAAIFQVVFPAAVRAQIRTVETLCRLHGIDQEETVAKIHDAFAAAVKAGVSEEELYPFVEDILKHKLDCGQMIRVLVATAKLQEEGLPYFVVFSKVREGVTKEAPPALVVEAAEAKFKTLSESRNVLKSLESAGYRVKDFRNAAVIVSSYLEKGYSPREVVTQIRNKGVEGSGFAALSVVLEKPPMRKKR